MGLCSQLQLWLCKMVLKSGDYCIWTQWAVPMYEVLNLGNMAIISLSQKQKVFHRTFGTHDNKQTIEPLEIILVRVLWLCWSHICYPAWFTLMGWEWNLYLNSFSPNCAPEILLSVLVVKYIRLGDVRSASTLSSSSTVCIKESTNGCGNT